MKRIVDIAGAALLLFLTWPLILLIGAVSRLLVGPPCLFLQERPGLSGKRFKIVKFRTMRNLSEVGPAQTEDSFRLTPFGRILRSTSLDELPELWNVFKGDMSLVGPRPLLRQYMDRYSPEQARRHEVKPGITGWAQVNGRNAISWDEKFKLDVWYVTNWSLALDMKIIGMTILKVLRREGISQAGEATMTEFMGNGSGQKPDSKFNRLDRFECWEYPHIEDGRLTQYNWMVQHKDKLQLGYNTDIGAFSYINAKYGVIIEDNVQIGSHCSIYSVSTIDGKSGSVVLKKNCKLGTHSVIMPGVTIGENAVIGAFSFVNRDVPDNMIALGIPAKVSRKLEI